MTTNRKTAFAAALLFIALYCASCAPGIRLYTRGAQDSEVTGKYRVVFYGCNFNNDFETIAFLDREDDQYTFEPYAPDFNYRVKKAVAAEEALQEARRFVNCNTAFQKAQLSAIISPSGDILGYEVRPLYHSFTYGIDDVLYTSYRMTNDKVVIMIRLNPAIERMLSGSGTGDRMDR